MIDKIETMKILSEQTQLEFFQKLRAAGLSDSDARVVIKSKDDELAKRIVEMIRSKTPSAFETATSQILAKAIMGQNYLSLDSVAQYLKIKPSKADLRLFAEVPFSEDTLKECKYTHILVPVLPISVLDILVRNKHLFYSNNNPWYPNESFANDRGKAGWHLVRKDIVPSSTFKTWQEQQSLLGKDEEISTARVLIYTIILTYLVTGAKLLPNIDARTSDLVSDRYRVFVGYFCDDGLEVSHTLNDARYDDCGVSSERKIDTNEHLKGGTLMNLYRVKLGSTEYHVTAESKEEAKVLVMEASTDTAYYAKYLQDAQYLKKSSRKKKGIVKKIEHGSFGGGPI